MRVQELGCFGGDVLADPVDDGLLLLGQRRLHLHAVRSLPTPGLLPLRHGDLRVSHKDVNMAQNYFESVTEC